MQQQNLNAVTLILVLGLGSTLNHSTAIRRGAAEQRAWAAV